jgi:hypothetical protein
VSAVNHDAGYAVNGVIVFFAERTVVLIEELINEFVDLFAIEVRRVLGLLEEEGGRILKLFCHD